MEALVRALRDGAPDAGHAPLLLLQDSLAAVGGPDVLLQAVAELAGSIAQGRAQARSLLLIALERPPADYLLLCASLAPGQLAVLDCFSDPFGWLTRAATHPKAVAAAADATAAAAAAQTAAPQSVAGVTMLAGVLQQPGGLQLLLQAAAPSAVPAGQAPAPRRCIVVDSLSRLLDSFGPRAVAHWVHQLQCAASTSCVLCALHADLHPPQALASLRLLTAGWAEVQPLLGSDRAVCSAPTGGGTGGGAAAGAAAPLPHGRVSVRLKRRAGRVRVEEQLFRVDPRAGPGVVSYWAAPPALSTSQALAGSAAPAAAAAGTAAGGQPGGSGGGVPGPIQPLAPAAAAAGEGAAAAAALSQQMEGGMRLSLTPEEEEARRRVQLPYEHQGKGAAYQTGDWRDYLPPEAGGRGAAGGGSGRRLGHILYVRDSGSEHDSDEDPDDDLDL